MDIYSKPDLYDAIHSHYSQDSQLITSIAKRAGDPVLELAAGTGRLAQLILDLGYNYTGLDLSREFVDVARAKYGEQATFVLGNMQEFHLSEQFKFIFIGFNSFLHNLTDQDANRCLNCVRNHLTKDGLFLVSIFIPDPSFLYREAGKLYPVTSLFECDGNKCRIMETNEFDNETQVNQLTWRLERDGQLTPEEYCYSMRIIYPHSMDILLSEAGLIIKEKLGHYDGAPMDEESGMQIYVCSKN